MITTLKILIFLMGLVALVTGLNVIIGGSSAVPGFSGPIDAAIDNELRFFSVFWLAYAGVSIWIALNLQSRFQLIPWIALVFFMGGLARLISLVSVGQPGFVLFSAMIAELILPPVLFAIYLRAQSVLPGLERTV